MVIHAQLMPPFSCLELVTDELVTDKWLNALPRNQTKIVTDNYLLVRNSHSRVAEKLRH